MSNQSASQIAQSAQVQTLYIQYINTTEVLTDDRLEALNDALYVICNQSFDLFEQVAMELGIA